MRGVQMKTEPYNASQNVLMGRRFPGGTSPPRGLLLVGGEGRRAT